MYWFSPVGNGLDCYRTWEALYVGSVPILERGNALDEFWTDADLPVLLVDDMRNVTKELLLQHAPRFLHRLRDFSRRKLLRAHWRFQILQLRQTRMEEWQRLQRTNQTTIPRQTLPAQAAGPLTDSSPNVEGVTWDWTRQRPVCWGSDMG
jgi:hypothetical protein